MNDRIGAQSNTMTLKEDPSIIDHWYKAYRYYHDAIENGGISKDSIGNMRSIRRLKDSRYRPTDKVSQIAYVYDQQDTIQAKDKSRRKSIISASDSSGIRKDTISIRYI